MRDMSTERQGNYLDDLAKICFAVTRDLGFDPDMYPDAETITRNMKGGTASKLIDAHVKYLGSHWNWRATSKQTVVAEFFYQWARANERDYVSRHDYDAFYRWIKNYRELELQSDFRPLVFTRNGENGKRVPVDLLTAEDQLRKLCSSMKDYVNKRLAENEQHNDGGLQKFEDDLEKLDLELEEEKPEELEEQKQEDEDKLPAAAEVFWGRYVELRAYAKEHNVGGHSFDSLERRPLEDGGKMIVEEIPVEAIVWAMCMTWPESNRRDKNIAEYDVKTFKPEKRVPGLPPEFPYLDALYRQRINAWLISPAGVGKTYTVRKFAEHYGQPWCSIPLNRGTAPSAFNGRPKVTNTSLMVRFLKAMANQDEEIMTKLAKQAEEDGDVTISEFTKIFRDGGHILLDEIDRADEGILMILNAPLANGYFANGATGTTVQKHPDTHFWAASNTDGLGVSAGKGREYRAANALDFATIDRFRMGRVRMEGDINDYRTMYEDLVLAYS